MPQPPNPPAKQPDRHYDFESMNKVFAWSAVALLVVTVLMVFFDYRQPWKRYQARFRDLERQKLLGELQAEKAKVDTQEVAELERQIAAEKAAQAQRRGSIRQAEDALASWKAKVYETDSRQKQTKSVLDAARYELDAAEQGKDAAAIASRRARVDSLSQELGQEQRAVQEATAQQAAAQKAYAATQADLDASEDKLKALEKGVDSARQRAARLKKSIDYYVLNAPLMDFLVPSLKVEQVMLPGLYHDIYFTKTERVDRCMTCHVAANRAGFEGEGWPEPLRSHPQLDLYVGDTSPHPYGKFGCTACHGGLDRATDFSRAGHSPKDAAQEKEWRAKYGWQEQKFLDTPILPSGLAQAGCVSCHAGAVWTPKADVEDVGRELVTHFGCYGCHKINYPAFTDLRKTGPSLERIAGKTNPGWAFKWIEAPRAFHPSTFMPHFFNQANVKGKLNQARQTAEIRGIVTYLWEKSEKPEYPPAPPGDAARGKQLFETVGCTGCHLLDANARRDMYFPQINRMHGPNLVRTGSKTSAGWVYAWVKNPRQYFPATNMPNLRLTDQEAADVTAYLTSSRDPAYENLSLPQSDPAARDGLVLGYLQATHTIEQSQAQLAAMSDHQRDVFLGQQSISKYGCYGCHDIKGFENAQPIGTELTEEGSKPLHLFDFGHVTSVADTRHDWIRNKLLQPRIYDQGKEDVKDYNELLKMPNFGMSEQEANAVLADVLGFTKESVTFTRRAGELDPRTAQLAAGRKLITRYNCQGCHLIEGEGHAIKTSITDPALLPPNLAAEGARVQSDWLFNWLHDPGQVRLRPWLTVRMPTFPFADDQFNAVVAYFNAREKTRPFQSAPAAGVPRDVAVGQVVFGMLQCARCHPAGAAAAATVGGAKGDLAPSLLLAHQRLRHDWVPLWIRDPQSWVAGTRMPSFFASDGHGKYLSPISAQALSSPTYAAQKASLLRQFGSESEMQAYLADVDKVTGALRDYVWTLGGPPPPAPAGRGPEAP